MNIVSGPVIVNQLQHSNDVFRKYRSDKVSALGEINSTATKLLLCIPRRRPRRRPSRRRPLIVVVVAAPLAILAILAILDAVAVPSPQPPRPRRPHQRPASQSTSPWRWRRAAFAPSPQASGPSSSSSLPSLLIGRRGGRTMSNWGACLNIFSEPVTVKQQLNYLCDVFRK